MAELLVSEQRHLGLGGPFEATHVLKDGAFLGYLPLRQLQPDSAEWTQVQIGRCVNERKERGGCGHAWAWKKGSARLAEMRCPACGGQLRQTTHELRRPFFLLPREIARMIATEVLQRERAAAYSRLYAKSVDGSEEVGLEQEMIGRLSARLAETQKLPQQTRRQLRLVTGRS